MREKIIKEGHRGMSMKRKLSVVLALVMVLTVLPLNNVTAYASETTVTLGTPVFSSTTECTVPVTVTGSVKTLSIAVTNAKLKLNSVSDTGYTFKNAVVSSSLCDSTPIANKEYLSVQLVVDNATAAQTALAGIKYCSITSDAKVKMSADTVSLADGDYYINGHYYTLSSSGSMSWNTAMEWAFNLQSDPSGSRYPGYKSYPVVVNSEEENQMLVNIWYNGGKQTKRQVFLPAVPVKPDGGSIVVDGSEGARTVTVTGEPYCNETMSIGHGSVYKWMKGTPAADTKLPEETSPFKYWEAGNPTDGGMVYFGHPTAGAYWDDLSVTSKGGGWGDNVWSAQITSPSFVGHMYALAEWEPADGSTMIVKTKALELPKVCKIGDTEYPTVESALKGASNNASTVPVGESAENPTVITMIANSTECITIPSSRYITLDLNGHVLKASSGSVIVNYGTLTINDSDSTTPHYFKVGYDGKWTLNENAENAKALEDLTSIPATNDIITVKGGCITGGAGQNIVNTGKRGGGIYNLNTIVINGGNIVGNSAQYGGGFESASGNNQYNNNTCVMNGGAFLGNYSSNAGNVNAHDFTMNNGLIAFNKAPNGAGIMAWGNENNNKLLGGKICYNKATTDNSGAGVAMYGYGEVGGNMTITNNYCNSTSSNLFLGYQLYLSHDPHITINDGFSGNIGIAIHDTIKPTSGSPYSFSSANSVDYSSYFTSDNESYEIQNVGSDDNQVLKLGLHSHTFDYSAANSKLIATCTCAKGASGCSYKDLDAGVEGRKVTFTLTTTSQTYSGSPVVKSDVFSLTDFDTFKNATGVPAVTKAEATSAIKIYATDEDGKKTGSDISSSTLDVGDYIAELDITVATDPSAVTKTVSENFVVNQAAASVSPAPAANTLTYSGEDQELVSADGCAVIGGVIKYSLEEEGDYTTDIPKGKNAGDYRVYYKIVSNSDNYKDSEAAYVDVTIGRKTFDGTMTVSGNILAGHASSGSLTLPELPENSQMMYSTPQTKESAISEGDLSIAGGKLLFKGSADVAEGNTYVVKIGIEPKTGENGNYENSTLTVYLIGKTCSHASKTDTPEVPAKCTEGGTKAYSTCDSCGSVFLNGEIIESPEDLIIHAPGHDWKVKADGNKLVASCSRKATCEATDKTLTLSIESKVYDGEAHAGTSISEDEKTAWEAIELEVPEIVYVGVDGTSYESTTPPTDIGSYEARISYGAGENKKTARASFMVNSPITVTFDPNGGRFESEMPPVYVVEGGKVAEPTIAVTNGGMIFYGWYKDPEGDEGDKWDFENDTVTEDITLYAVWGYPAGVETEAAEMSVARVKDFYYTGKKITPDVRVYFGGKLLTRNIDYTVSYKNVVNVCTASVSNNLIVRDDGSVDYSNVDTRQPSIIIKGKGNYSKKSVALNFNILPLTLGEGAAVPDKKVSADITDVYLQNVKKAIKVKPVIKYSGKKLKKNRDYTLVLKAVNASDASGTAIASGTEYSDLRLPKGVTGTFALTVSGKGNYTGGFIKTITVTAGEVLTLQKAKVKIKKIPYSGESLEIRDVVDKGNLTVKVKGKKLTYGEDYTVAFAEGYSTESRLSAGAYPIVITGKGSYSGTKMTNAVVKGIPVKKAAVTFTEEKPVYTGKHIGLNIDSVTVSVKVNGETTQKTLVRGVDYTATVLNDVKAGKAKVKITGTGAFAGSKTVSYRIQKKELTPDMFASGTFTDDTVALGTFDYYGGARVIPTASISYNGVALISPTDYTVKARNNKNASSKATGTIVGKGNYTGSIKCTFSIGDDTVDAAKTSIAKARVKIENQIYTGNAITLKADSFKKMKLKVKEDGRTVTKDLVLGRDFEIVEGSYRNNVNRTGKVKATVTLRGIGANGFDGYKTVKFRIVKKDLRWWEKIGNLL